MKLGIFAILLLSTTLAIASQKRVGKVFKKTQDANPILIYQSEIKTTKSEWTRIVTYTRPDKSIVVREVSVYSKGNDLREYTMEQNQIACNAKITKSGSNYKFSVAINGTRQRGIELSDSGSVVTGNGVESLIEKNWKSLMAGKTIRFNLLLGCAQRMAPVKVRKIKSRKIGSKSYLTIEASPQKGKKKSEISFFYYEAKKKLKGFEGYIPLTIGDSTTASIWF